MVKPDVGVLNQDAGGAEVETDVSRLLGERNNQSVIESHWSFGFFLESYRPFTFGVLELERCHLKMLPGASQLST